MQVRYRTPKDPYKKKAEKIREEVDDIFIKHVLPLLEKFIPKSRCRKIMSEIKFDTVQRYFSVMGQFEFLSEDTFRCKLHESICNAVKKNSTGKIESEESLYEAIDAITPMLYQQVRKRDIFPTSKRSSVFV